MPLLIERCLLYVGTASVLRGERCCFELRQGSIGRAIMRVTHTLYQNSADAITIRRTLKHIHLPLILIFVWYVAVWQGG